MFNWSRSTNCVCADVFCIPDIYGIIVLIFYFFLEPALMGLCPSGFQPPMANKYCCCTVISKLILDSKMIKEERRLFT